MSLLRAALAFVMVLAVAFFSIHYVINDFIFERIRVIYKTVLNQRHSKEQTKRLIKQHEDIIEKVDSDVRQWADRQLAEIETLKARNGYTTADVISLRPETPNLDVMLAKFDKEHLHTEDEVRFVVDGRGVFTIHSDTDDKVFDVEVHPGDLLVVPINTWHWFTLCDDRQIKCIRLFQDTTGWTPHYREA